MTSGQTFDGRKLVSVRTADPRVCAQVNELISHLFSLLVPTGLVCYISADEPQLAAGTNIHLYLRFHSHLDQYLEYFGYMYSHTDESINKSGKTETSNFIGVTQIQTIEGTQKYIFPHQSVTAAQKKSEATTRRLGGLRVAPPFFLRIGVFFTVALSRVGGDFSTPYLGFCCGSKGTRDVPSGLTNRLRSDFLNSAPIRAETVLTSLRIQTTSLDLTSVNAHQHHPPPSPPAS